MLHKILWWDIPKATEITISAFYLKNSWGDCLMPAQHNWNLGSSMSNLAKLKIQQDKLANLHLLINAFEVNFKEPDQKFEFCEGINLLLFFISYFDA